MGHILYILKHIQNQTTEQSLIANKYVRLTGKYDKDSLGKKQRQTKYKLQAMMQLGILVDSRYTKSNTIKLTELGEKLLKNFSNLINSNEIETKDSESWSMSKKESFYNTAICNYLKNNNDAKKVWYSILMRFNAFEQLLRVLYTEYQVKLIDKDNLYDNFFNNPYILHYIELNGIEIPTVEARKRRIPFLNNLAESIGLVTVNKSTITINKLLIYPKLVNCTNEREFNSISLEIKDPQKIKFSDKTLYLKEIFGMNFGTKDYNFSKNDTIFYEGIYEKNYY